MPGTFNSEDRERLVRLEERLVSLKEDISAISERIDYERDFSQSTYVTKTENEPVKKFVYAASGFIMTGLVAVIVTAIFRFLGH